MSQGTFDKLNEALQVQLDRQAAITERKMRELSIGFQLESDKRITELQTQVDELTAERYELREKLGCAIDHAYGIITLVDLEGNVVS